MFNVTGNFSDDMRKYVLKVPPLPATVMGAEITLPTVVFEFDTGSGTTPADVASALQSYVGKCSPAPATRANYLCPWLRSNTDLDKGITSAFERALENDNGHNSLGRHVASVTYLDPSHKPTNELRLAWAQHCITALLSTPSPRNKEMNDKHNHRLLRPVKLKDLQVGDVLILKDSSPISKSSVAYKANKFVVLRYRDGSEGVCFQSRLEISYGLAPLCWVEGKPVYPGDVLYRPEVEGDKALVASHIERSDSGTEDLHFSNLAGANKFADNRRSYLTWTKPEPERVPSFQVEGQDVFPGDPVYYYGDERCVWGRKMCVEEGARVDGVDVHSLSQGAASFRLKPQLVIGDRLVPMPEREAPAEGTTYYTQSALRLDLYIEHCWTDNTHNRRWLERGQVHLTKEAAIAHGEALIALSKKD